MAGDAQRLLYDRAIVVSFHIYEDTKGLEKALHADLGARRSAPPPRE